MAFEYSLSATTTTLLVAALGACIHLGRKLWAMRAPVAAMKALGKPMPAWSFLFGHLIAAGKVFDRLPPACHSSYLLRLMSRDCPGGAFYFDAWPLNEPLLVVTDPDMAYVAETHPKVGATKPKALEGWLEPISGGPAQFTLNGRPWKHIHDLFSPAFSNQNINAMAPVITNRIEIFLQIMREKAASGERFLLEPKILSLINDMICETLFGMESDVQRQGHPLTEAMMNQLRLKFTVYDPANMFAALNPFTRYKLWANNRVLDAGMRAQLQKRFDMYRSNKTESEMRDFKPLIDIAIEDYLSRPGNANATTMDPDFVLLMTRNLRATFFVGYDSTAGCVIYCYYLLWQNPKALARLREEHDRVFGADISSVTRQISEKPHTLNSLPYTLAVIKESLRLFPLASGLRDGSPDLELVDSEGNTYPTAGFQVVIPHFTIHTQKAWARAEEFLPERWLVERGHELYPPAKAWRPFANGVRACPGQQQVYTEVKAVLACTVREFDIRECYAEVDAGKKPLDLSQVGGHRPYMIDAGSAHPQGEFPCRVSLSGYTPKAG